VTASEAMAEVARILTHGENAALPIYQIAGEIGKLRAIVDSGTEKTLTQIRNEERAALLREQDRRRQPNDEVKRSASTQVIVPYTNLRDETRDSVLRYAPDARFVYLGDDEAYWRLVSGLWREQRDYIIVEHDIVIHEDAISQFEACPEPWCTFGYPYFLGDAPYHGTGCVRWRAEAMRAMPDLLEVVGEMSGPHHPQRHWCSLDGFSQATIWARSDFRAHHHDPPVGHTDTAASHTCQATF